MPHVARPVLNHKPGPIGGHCVMLNLELLGGNIATFIKERNHSYIENTILTPAA